MSHEWERLPDTIEKTCKHGWEPRRQCLNCGIVQQIDREQSWGRVVRRRWLPLAGKCKTTKKEDKNDS